MMYLYCHFLWIEIEIVLLPRHLNLNMYGLYVRCLRLWCDDGVMTLRRHLLQLALALVSLQGGTVQLASF